MKTLQTIHYQMTEEERTRRRRISLNNILGSFAMGIIQTYHWHWNYVVPPHFGEVIQSLGTHLQSLYPIDSVIETSINEVEAIYNAFIESNSNVQGWKSHHGEFTLVFCDNPMYPSPTFINLQALCLAAITTLYNQTSAQVVRGLNPNTPGFWWFWDKKCSRTPEPVRVAYNSLLDPSAGLQFSHSCNYHGGVLQVSYWPDAWYGPCCKPDIPSI